MPRFNAIWLSLCLAVTCALSLPAQVWIYRDSPDLGLPQTPSEKLFEPYGVMKGPAGARVALDISHLIDPKDESRGSATEVIFSFSNSTDWAGTYWLLENGTAWGSKPGINVQELLSAKPNEGVMLRWQAWGSGQVTFKTGGVFDGQYPSSCPALECAGAPVTLTDAPREFAIGPIPAGRLVNSIDPLCVVASGLDQKRVDGRPANVKVYVDNLRFELQRAKPGKRGRDWQAQLLNTLFIAYTPTGYDPTAAPVKRASPDAIRTDLNRIKQLALDSGVTGAIGITTYGCDHGIEQVCGIAAELELKILLGIFDPNNATEVANCKALLADSNLTSAIAGVVVGNETLTFRRGSLADVQRVMKELREVSDAPMTTTEIVQAYSNQRLFTICDFTLINAHGIFAGKFDPLECADWTINQIVALRKAAPNKQPILIREAGYPSAPEPFTDDKQRQFWEKLLASDEAKEVNILIFDGLKNVDWKVEKITVPSVAGELNVGPHWPVLFGADNQPKPFSSSLIQQWQKTRPRHNK